MHKKIVIGAIVLFLLVMTTLSVAQIYNGGYKVAGLKTNTLGVIEINGVIAEEAAAGLIGTGTANSLEIMKAIREAGDREDIKVVLVRINSPGGTSVASQEIGIELDKLRKKGKKVVVSMGEVCASGGYWIACSSDYIVANPGTLTGSIGVIMEFTNLEGLYEKIGVDQNVIKSGDLKDIGSSYREMTEPERIILKDIIDDSYQQFLEQIRRGRKGKIEEERLLEIADGRIFTGETALQLGLVDSLGNYYDAIDKSKQIGNLHADCEVEVINSPGYWDLLRNINTMGILKDTGLMDLKYPVLKYIY